MIGLSTFSLLKINVYQVVYYIIFSSVFKIEKMFSEKIRQLRSLINRGFSGIPAAKPSCFRLTKTQLAVRRSGPRFSNNYCVSDHCVAIFLWFVGLFHQIFAGCSPH